MNHTSMQMQHYASCGIWQQLSPTATLKTMPALTRLAFFALSRQADSRNSSPIPKPTFLDSLSTSASCPFSYGQISVSVQPKHEAIYASPDRHSLKRDNCNMDMEKFLETLPHAFDSGISAQAFQGVCRQIEDMDIYFV